MCVQVLVVIILTIIIMNKSQHLCTPVPLSPQHGDDDNIYFTELLGAINKNVCKK